MHAMSQDKPICGSKKGSCMNVIKRVCLKLGILKLILMCMTIMQHQFNADGKRCLLLILFLVQSVVAALQLTSWSKKQRNKHCSPLPPFSTHCTSRKYKDAKQCSFKVSTCVVSITGSLIFELPISFSSPQNERRHRSKRLLPDETLVPSIQSASLQRQGFEGFLFPFSYVNCPKCQRQVIG